MEKKHLAVSDFCDLAKDTHGMMPGENYFALYELALNSSVENIIDVGVGRGATTIAYALGLMHGGSAGKVDLFNKTAVFRKVNPDLFSSFDISGIEQIESDIVGEFLSASIPN